MPDLGVSGNHEGGVRDECGQRAGVVRPASTASSGRLARSATVGPAARPQVSRSPRPAPGAASARHGREAPGGQRRSADFARMQPVCRTARYRPGWPPGRERGRRRSRGSAGMLCQRSSRHQRYLMLIVSPQWTAGWPAAGQAKATSRAGAAPASNVWDCGLDRAG
jgi:hypothetical protein